METELAKATGGKETSAEYPASYPPDADVQPDLESVIGGNAANLAVEYEGLRHGRKRLDGLVPGSKEAAKANRLYDNIRKWQDRNPGMVHPQEKSLHPAIASRIAARRKPLPTGTAPVAAAMRSIPVQEVAPPLPATDSQAVDPAVREMDDLAAATQSAIIAWAGTDIEPLLQELLAVIEDWKNFIRERQLRRANLPATSIKEFEEETRWSDRWKKVIHESGSRVVAKLLNKAGISAEYKDEIFLGLAVVAIVGNEIRIARRIPQLIAAANAGARIQTDQQQK